MGELSGFVKDFARRHVILTLLLILVFILAIVAAVGVQYFGWDLAQMYHDVKNFVMGMAYKPFNRSFDDLKGTVGGW